MIILTIVGSATALAIMSGTNSSSVTSARVAATNLAQQTLQQAMDMPRSQLTATSTTTTVGNAQYTVARTLTFSVPSATTCPTTAPAGTANTVTVHVIVSSGSGTLARSVTMDTVLAC